MKVNKLMHTRRAKGDTGGRSSSRNVGGGHGSGHEGVTRYQYTLSLMIKQSKTGVQLNAWAVCVKQESETTYNGRGVLCKAELHKAR